jgi:hypothetical protein
MSVSSYGMSLRDPTAVSSSGAGAAHAGCGGSLSLTVAVVVTAVPTGTSNSLDVFLQTSYDSGSTWFDMAHTTFTTSIGTKLIQLNRCEDVLRRENGPILPPSQTSDGQLAGETVLPNSYGDRLRLKWAFAAGDSTGSYTLGASFGMC